MGELQTLSKDELRVAIGKRLRHFRQQNRWSQEQVAEWSDLPAAEISHLETGKRSPSAWTLYRLCIGMRCSADRLLGFNA